MGIVGLTTSGTAGVGFVLLLARAVWYGVTVSGPSGGIGIGPGVTIRGLVVLGTARVGLMDAAMWGVGRTSSRCGSFGGGLLDR